MRGHRLILMCLFFILSTGIASASLPVISNISPSNDSLVILSGSNVLLKANITDADGDLTYVAFETNKTGSWAKIVEMTFSGNNWSTSSPITFSGLEKNKKYYWRILSHDSEGNWTNSSVLSFTTSGGTEGGEISIVPPQPKAKKNVIFVAGEENAAGYVICYETGNVYLLELYKGVGLVEFGLEYGMAEVYIIGYGSRSFEIQSPYSGELQINSPSDAQIDESVDIMVTAQGEPVQVTLEMTSPTNKKMTRITGNDPIRVEFNEVGEWNMTAKLYQTTATKTIQINPEPIELQISDEMLLGEENIIRTSPSAMVVIEKGEISWSLTADDSGQAFFTPEWTGRYKATATSYGQKGTKYFNVVTDTTISVKNDKNEIVSKIKKDDVLLIQVFDSKGNIIAGSSTVKVLGDGLEIANLQILSGSALWHVTSDASTYVFEYDTDEALYLPASLSVSGSAIFSQPGGVDAIYIYIGVAIVIVIIVIYILHIKGFIDLKSIFPSKEEEPLL